MLALGCYTCTRLSIGRNYLTTYATPQKFHAEALSPSLTQKPGTRNPYFLEEPKNLRTKAIADKVECSTDAALLQAPQHTLKDLLTCNLQSFNLWSWFLSRPGGLASFNFESKHTGWKQNS